MKLAHCTGAQAYYRSKFALAAFTFDLAEERTVTAELFAPFLTSSGTRTLRKQRAQPIT